MRSIGNIACDVDFNLLEIHMNRSVVLGKRGLLGSSPAAIPFRLIRITMPVVEAKLFSQEHPRI